MSLTAKSIPIEWHPGLPIFASEAFLKAVGDEYGWLGGVDESGQVRCILPYTIIHKLGFRLVRFRVETIFLGAELGIEEEKTFLESVVKYLRASGADLIIPATTNTIFRTYPDGAVAAPYGTYIIDLQKPEETLFGNFSATNRQDTRNAIKRGVKIHVGMQYLEPVYYLTRDTFSRSKLPFMSLAAFVKMVNSVGESARIFVAEYQGVIQYSMVCFFSNHRAYAVYGGTIPKPVGGATKLLHWEAIRQFRDLGIEQYDLVGARIDPEKGSKQENIMLFKARLGSRLSRGYMWKYPLRPMKFAAYCLAVRILRGGDIVDAEGYKLRKMPVCSPIVNAGAAASQK